MTSFLDVGELVGSVVGLLVLAAGVRAFTKRYRLPYTVTLVVVGIVLSGLADID